MHSSQALPHHFPNALLPVFIGAALLLGACSKTEAPPKAGGTMPVTVLEMQPRSVPNAVEIVAQTEGAKETEVRARVGGILMKQLYQEGMPVKAGQPLFQIDRAPYAIAHAEAKAKADQAARELARLKKLVDIQGVSRKEYDDAISANELAQAALRQAQLNLSWTTITAPVDGVSGRAAKSVGNLVTVGSDSLLTSVYQNDPMWVRFSISTNEAERLPGGRLTPDTVTGVELVLPDGSIFPVKGKLNFLASTIDPTLGTRQLRAEFRNTEGRLLPGQFVRIRLLAGEQGGIFLVPQSAVIQSEQGNLVMTTDAENKVAPRPVKTGEWFGKDWIVLDGLKAGDKVIVDNLMKLRPGAPVDPHPPAPPAADAAKPVQK